MEHLLDNPSVRLLKDEQVREKYKAACTASKLGKHTEEFVEAGRDLINHLETINPDTYIYWDTETDKYGVNQDKFIILGNLF